MYPAHRRRRRRRHRIKIRRMSLIQGDQRLLEASQGQCVSWIGLRPFGMLHRNTVWSKTQGIF